jgi:hypothetical protein
MATVTKQTFAALRKYKKRNWQNLIEWLTGIVASLSGKDFEDPDVKEITAWILYGLAGVLRAKRNEDRERTSLSRYLWGAAKRRVAGYFRRHGRYLYLADEDLIPLADARATSKNRIENDWVSDTLESLTDDVARRVARHAAQSTAASIASTCKSTREANAQYQRSRRDKMVTRTLVLRDAICAGIDIPTRVRLGLERRSAARATAKSATH